MERLKLLGLVTVFFTNLLILSTFFAQSAAAAWEMNTDRPGMDIIEAAKPGVQYSGSPFWISKDVEAFVALQICEDACKKRTDCKAFTYVKPGVQGKDGRCWLKRSVPKAVTNTCCTSGIVRPETKADYCNNYALKAVEAYLNNINWKCGYGGARWHDNYKVHYDWCMKVPQSAADSEMKERQDSLDQCLKPSTSGDLEAFDWCWEKDATNTTITFYPIIKNGPTKWASEKEGYYKIGLGFGTVLTEKKYVLPKFPYFFLGPHETHRLDGFQLPYHDENEYMVENIWMLWHPEDINISNNGHSGLKGVYKGKSFSTNKTLSDKQCK